MAPHVRILPLMQVFVVFLLYNSAWSCTGDDDYQHIFIGKQQLEQLLQQMKGLPEPVLTIGVMHHPLDWLEPSERKVFLEYLGNSYHLPVEVLLHGHIHNGSLDLTGNPDRTMVSLVSGTGYPDGDKRASGTPKMTGCRYAIYRFTPETKTVEVWLRTTRSDGGFAADTLLYNAGKDTGHFSSSMASMRAKIVHQPPW